MQLRVFHAFWGMPGTLREKFERAAKNGYAGIESPMPTLEDESEFRELLDEFKLAYIPQVFTFGPDHIEKFISVVERAITFTPVLINSQSAKDSMPDDDQDRFFEAAIQVEKASGYLVAHETHRGRSMFTPWATARLLNAHPNLKITADFSHFTCVCESMLDDQRDNLLLAISRAVHIHGRIGHIEGPQVPHPAAPEYANELATFEGWWAEIFAARRAAGVTFQTFTPEFGPPGYMQRLPFTRQAISDLFEVNHWVGERIKSKFPNM